MMDKYTEAQHQSFVMRWSRQPKIRNRWPELELMFHIPNEGARSGKTGNILKHQGMKRGVPDLCLPVARGSYHGLFIEMKRPGAVDDEKHKAEQEWWIRGLMEQGYFAEVCHGWESAVQVLEWYLSNPRVEIEVTEE